MPTTTEAELSRTIRNIQRLQTQMRRLRRQLKAAGHDVRLERRHLKALSFRSWIAIRSPHTPSIHTGRGHRQELEQRRPDVAPLRVFAGAVGMAAHATLQPTSAPPGRSGQKEGDQ